MKLKNAMLAIVLAAVAFTANSASAVDYHGYFRDGFGFNSKGGNAACFSIATFNKARLGNECDYYLEVELSQTIYKDDNGVEMKYVFMPAYGLSQNLPDGAIGGASTGYGYGTGNLYVQQNYAVAKLPQLGGASIWMGNRYWNRENVDSYDFFYFNATQGNAAAGIEDVDLGFGKMAFTVVRLLDSQAAVNPQLGVWMMPDIRLYNIPLIPNGTLQLVVDLGVPMQQNNALGADAKISPWFTVDYLQDKLFGGSNKLTFQFASGALSGMGQKANGSLTSDNKHFRVIDQLYIDPTPEWSSAFVVIWDGVSTPTTAAGSGVNTFSFEVRPQYHFSDYFKVSADVSYQIASLKDAPAGTDSAHVLKVTVAPTLVAGRGYWARPEFRLFGTYGTWNTAAGTAGTNGAFGTDTHGLTFGAQVEGWF